MNSNFGIKGFISTSLVDWPGKICSVVFLGGCGFRCPACHNPTLVLNPGSLPDYPLEEICRSLSNRSKWIDGVTVTGGEPTGSQEFAGSFENSKKIWSQDQARHQWFESTNARRFDLLGSDRRGIYGREGAAGLGRILRGRGRAHRYRDNQAVDPTSPTLSD